MAADRRFVRRAGFTMVELMVAMVIAGMLTGVIYQIIAGQGRFSAVQNARQEVQQNSRGALDLIASELRGLAPGGIVAAQQNAVQFRLPRTWGVLCDDAAAGGGSIRVRFPADGFPTDEFAYGNNRWGLVLVDAAPDSIRAPADPGTALSCDGALGTAVGVTMDRSFDYSSLTNAYAAGTPVYLYEEVRYDVQNSTLTGEDLPWIRRMLGFQGATSTTPNMQPVAGPLDGAGGLAFSYYVDDGVTGWTATPTALQLEDITRIQVTVEVRSTGRLNNVAQSESASTIVELRNR